MLISQALATTASKNLSRPAFRYLGKETSFGELRTNIGRLSYLFQHDLGHGARVAFFARNSPAYIQTLFALSNTRSVTIPVNPDALPDDLIACLKESKATHLAVTSDLVGKARDLLHSAHLSLPIVDIEKKHGGEYDTSYTPPADNKPLETDVILLLRTGGISGKPRFVTFTHKQIQHAATALRGVYHVSAVDRVHTNLSWSNPFAFVHGMLFPLLIGATTVIDHGLEAVEFLEFLTESRVTRMLGTPQYFLKTLITCKNEKRGLPGVKSVTVGMGQLSPEVRKVFAALKIPACHCYGQTENLWTISMQDTEGDDEERKGMAGKGLPGLKYKVIDNNGDEIPGKDSRTGMLAVMGPTVMNGYLDLEKETKAAIRGTWLYTGDIATLEGDGDELRIAFLGRREDLVQRDDGKFYSPSQADPVLKTLQGVQDGAVFTIRNSKGETAIAVAIVKAQGSPLNEKQVLDFCAGKIPSSLLPKFAVFTDFIPRDAGGNVNAARLRAQFSGIAG